MELLPSAASYFEALHRHCGTKFIIYNSQRLIKCCYTFITRIFQKYSPENGFMQKLLGAEAAAILGSMTAATVLMLGGAKTKRKNTRRRRNKGNKSTKRHKQK